MDWSDFFERTRVAAGVESFAKLAPKLGITDGAIGHYRQGRQIPSVWVVADCLKIQGHPTPEKAAVEIMRTEARTSTERSFWKRLAATAALLMIVVAPTLSQQAHAATMHQVATGADLASLAPAAAIAAAHTRHYAKYPQVGTIPA